MLTAQPCSTPKCDYALDCKAVFAQGRAFSNFASLSASNWIHRRVHKEHESARGTSEGAKGRGGIVGVDKRPGETDRDRARVKERKGGRKREREKDR